MCRRFERVSPDDAARIIECLNADDPASVESALQGLQLADAGEAYPSSEACIILDGDGKLADRTMTWGIPVDWQERPLANARLETALEPGSLWHEALDCRRCLVPERGFYESHRSRLMASQRTGRPVKQQVRFVSPKHPVLFMAGIYQDGGFALVTTEPSACVGAVRDRMPLALAPDEARRWLEGPPSELASLADRTGLALLAQPEGKALPEQASLF